MRPGLQEFLEWAESRFERIVIYSTVPAHRVSEIQQVLLDLGDVTPQFASLECVEWPRRGHKDLRFVDQDWQRVIMVDDLPEEYMMPEQHEQWVKIAPFNGEASDRELFNLPANLQTMLT
ncbi:HAD family hydrolase [Photobacterium sp. ZSDE20]|nr:HAD family hydrolase [Photobacterium sp. ZSDE20]